jgi:uncharacterized protein
MTADLTQRAMLPSPGWNANTEDFWLAAGKKQLVVQRCSACGFHRWPPNPGCYNCTSMDYAWSPVSGTGTVFSYTWADYPPPPEGERNITVVELDGTQGEPVRMISWVVDVPREDLVCGLPVEVTFLPLDEEVAVPAWRPRR